MRMAEQDECLNCGRRIRRPEGGRWAHERPDGSRYQRCVEAPDPATSPAVVPDDDAAGGAS